MSFTNTQKKTKCNRCPYRYGEIDQCMIGEDGDPDNLEKKCEKEENLKNEEELYM